MNLSNGFTKKAITLKRYKIIFSQKSLGVVLRDYVYALTDWSLSGGDDRLSAEDALDKARSAIVEMISIAQQVKYVFKSML